ncbi:T6SS effector phospholipase Tle3 domain-containing protein [Luteibacter sp.]|uniref:T6SS effector phospholipase Tle3 domain-containing protein n=1 Tax=Luteibacter sp. TaxID=1886636 RepID=UPI002F40D140
MPGIVIFAHGVNDPGGNYDIIEKGLCDGLNERLDAFRLIPGRYGREYEAAQKSKTKSGDSDYDKVAEVKYDPDTYLYKREEFGSDVGKRTHSVFIPFYWGYRAAEEEIAYEEPQKDEVTRRYKTVRGQYQDVHGNRLNKHFAKGGGTFNNATTSIPSMFDEGFYNSNVNGSVRWAGGFDPYQFSGTSPHRRYMVLAAERLAMLVREIRRVAPDDTITIMGHSQGTLVTLLAQAMLAEGNPARTFERQAIEALPPARCADTLVLVDSPYSLREPGSEASAQPRRKRYSSRGKINTLVNIVGAVTEKPHTVPPLAELSPAIKGNRRHNARAGMRWQGAGEAVRRESNRTLIPFVERDNRGKVYMYYCPEDGTVGLMNIAGIGAEGVPDYVDVLASPEERRSFHARAAANGFAGQTPGQYPAMATLAGKRFFQRAWTRQAKDHRGKDTAVGQPPPYRLVFDVECQINAESISPPYEPAMYGGEAIKGNARRAGLVVPNDYAKDLAIGNPDEDMPFLLLAKEESYSAPDPEAVMKAFNKDKEPDDQTYTVRVERKFSLSFSGPRTYLVMREETPNETRQRLERDKDAWQKNNYHSAILSDADNLRRVVAFDVAVGQAKVLDDPDWRRLFIGLADWKMDEDAFSKIKTNPRFAELSIAARSLTQGCHMYYMKGMFPASLVRTEIPSPIDAERR